MSTVSEARAAFRINGGDVHPGTLTLIRDTQRVDTMGPRVDTRWNAWDEAGHFHAYSTTEGGHYPTLFQREIICASEHHDDAWWCECRTEWECQICRAPVTPGMIPGPHTEMRPGLSHWEVALECPPGCRGHEVGAMVSLRASLADAVRFGIAVVTSVNRASPVAHLVVTKSMLTGAGPLGEAAR